MNGGWRTAPLRRSLVRIRASNTDSAATLLSLTIDGATVPRTGEDGLGQQAPSESTIQNYALVEPEQLVVNPMWLVGGSIGVSTLSGAVSPAYRVYSINDSIEPRFLHHVVRSTSYRSFYRMLARGETTFDRAVSAEDFEGLPFKWPSLDEQRRIADFLDDRVARIDQIIKGRRTQVDLLKLHLEATVVKGVRQDGWSSRRLGSIARFHFGVAFPLDYQGAAAGAFPLIKVGDMAQADGLRRLGTAANWITLEQCRLLGAHVAPPSTIIFPKVGAALLTNSRAVLTRPAAFDNNVMGIEVPGGDERFWFYVLSSLDFGRLSNPGPVPSIGRESVAELRVAVPPIAEQRRVGERLDRKRQSAHDQIQSLQSAISLLEEYKQSLITAAVTGEIDVTTAGSGIPG